MKPNNCISTILEHISQVLMKFENKTIKRYNSLEKKLNATYVGWPANRDQDNS